jgi:hypothetical protein
MKSADGAQGGRFVVEGRIRVARYATNTRGRDFVVGDLHGCRALLDRLLREVNFRPESDRLFSVGDLIDRGPESMSCLDLLDEPWCHGVLGNHEVMLIDFFSRALALGGLNTTPSLNVLGFSLPTSPVSLVAYLRSSIPTVSKSRESVPPLQGRYKLGLSIPLSYP